MQIPAINYRYLSLIAGICRCALNVKPACDRRVLRVKELVAYAAFTVCFLTAAINSGVVASEFAEGLEGIELTRT